MNMKELIEAQDEYIKLLEEAENSNIGFLYAHGITTAPDLVERGKKSRQKIEELKSQVEKVDIQ